MKQLVQVLAGVAALTNLQGLGAAIYQQDNNPIPNPLPEGVDNSTNSYSTFAPLGDEGIEGSASEKFSIDELRQALEVTEELERLGILEKFLETCEMSHGDRSYLLRPFLSEDLGTLDKTAGISMTISHENGPVEEVVVSEVTDPKNFIWQTLGDVGFLTSGDRQYLVITYAQCQSTGVEEVSYFAKVMDLESRIFLTLDNNTEISLSGVDGSKVCRKPNPTISKQCDSGRVVLEFGADNNETQTLEMEVQDGRLVLPSSISSCTQTPLPSASNTQTPLPSPSAQNSKGLSNDSYGVITGLMSLFFALTAARYICGRCGSKNEGQQLSGEVEMGDPDTIVRDHSSEKLLEEGRVTSQ